MLKPREAESTTGMASRSLRLSAGKKLLFGTVLTLLFFAVGEGVCRLIGFDEPTSIQLEDVNPTHISASGKDSLYRNHPSLIWELRPGGREKLGGDSPNEDTFRGPLIVREKPEHTFRVAVMGDSCTYGLGLTVEQTYARRLEDRLSRLHRGRNIEVLNGGVPGYSIFQGQLALKQKILPYRPDVVVLYFGGFNDGKASTRFTDREWSDRMRRDHDTSLLGRIGRSMRALQLYRALSIGAAWLADDGDRPSQESITQAWLNGEPLFGVRVPPADFVSLLEETVTLCRESGARPLIILPELNQTFIERDWFERWGTQHRRYLEQYRDLLDAAAERLGVPTVDQRQIVQGFEDSRAVFRDGDPVHPDANGSILLALALADVIEAEGWIDEKATSGVAPRRRPLECDALGLDRGQPTITFALEAGPEHAGEHFWLLPSFRANRARYHDPSPRFPLEIDRLAQALLKQPELAGEEGVAGTLDAAGRARIRVRIPDGIFEGGHRLLGFAFFTSAREPELTVHPCRHCRESSGRMLFLVLGEGSFVSNDVWLTLGEG